MVIVTFFNRTTDALEQTKIANGERIQLHSCGALVVLGDDQDNPIATFKTWENARVGEKF